MVKFEFIDANDSKNFFRLGKVPFYFKTPKPEQFNQFIKEITEDTEEDGKTEKKKEIE